ncbi:hypothetical protein BC332_18112 [Capsicum chinense]|nr:hypothetical protein BC332_18112 [Capsicum chinense]
MAFAAVTVCLQTLDQTFSSNPFLNLDKDEHCQFLSEKLGIFKRVLEDSTNKCDDLGKVEDLERRIRDVSYRAQDYVEELAFFSWKDMDLLECYDRVYSTKGCLSQIVDEIKLIESEVMKIYEQMSCLANVNESESYLLESSAEKSSGVQDIVVGLDDDVLEIKTRLCSFSSKLEIVSLVGMGGIGKSTLARMVYDDSFIQYHFSIRAWVTVKNRQVKGLFLGLLDGIVEFIDEIHEKHSEQLEEMLYRKLKHNRYLIVLDDVWSTEVWDKVRRCFPDDKNGSRILLTTRLTEVALLAKSDSAPYCLKLLDLEESWELLCQKVFGRKFNHPDLKDIGKKIAERCQGLPLTILVVAGQLSKLQRTRMCWETFAKTVGSTVTDEYKKCLDILALSYRNLPHHLKACFIYICAFPAETAIRVQLLVNLWIAEGFLTTGKQKTFENYAEECLEDLVNRSLVIVKQRKSNGRVKSCAVHDILRDLGLREAQRENFFHFPEFFATADILHCGRRLSYDTAASIEVPWKPLLPLSRTLLLSSSEIAPCFWSRLLGSLQYKLLRVLRIVHVTFDYFPTQVLQLVHLRYLALTVKDPKCPELISRLWNLQTFVLDTRGILNLPKTVWEMENLRHVCLGNGCFLPNPMSSFNGCKVLTNLQTITYVDIMSCTREVAENVPNLKKLAIQGHGDGASSQPSYYLNNLFHLKQLEKLKLCYHNLSSMDFFPSNLKKLVLNRCSLSCGFTSSLCMLPNLEILKLECVEFEQHTWNLTEEVFSHLKYLKMVAFNLRVWNASEVNFLKLEHLVLESCYSLENFPHEVGNIYTLQCIEVLSCSVAVEMSVQRVQEEQNNMGNDSLNVSIPYKGSINVSIPDKRIVDISIPENDSLDVSIPENGSLDVSIPEKGCLNVSIPENVSVSISVTVRDSLKVSISGKGSFSIKLSGKGSLNVSIPEKGTLNVFVPVKGSLNIFVPGKGIFSIFVPVKGSLNVSIPGKGSFYVFVPVKGSLDVFIQEKGGLNLSFQHQSF